MHDKRAVTRSWPCQKIMAQSDRWTQKILALPFFDDAFAQAICQTPMCNLAFVAAMDLSSAGEFTEKISSWSSSFEDEVVFELLKDTNRLETFWSLACSAERVFFESTSFQLGFGKCQKAVIANAVKATDLTGKDRAVKALLQVPKPPSKKLKQTTEASSSNTPLLDHENSEKSKWAKRLEAIGTRAGSESKLLTLQGQSDSLSVGEISRLRNLVMLSGAHRTMAAHVRAFERFELWANANSVALYPLTVDKVLKYCLKLDQDECGPSVVPTFKTSIKWVCSRLAIDLPDLEDRRIKALQEQIVSARATTLKEAIPFPISTVAALEAMVCYERDNVESRLFIWWMLCMVFASLRFDDAIHVRPSELIMKEEGLFGIAWQTKVERKRAGTRFMVPRVGFHTDCWLGVGWELFTKHENLDRDYWVRELNTRSSWLDRPPTHQRSVQWFRVFAHQATILNSTIPKEERRVLIEQLKGVTAHSCRVTLLDAAVHAGRSTEEIGLQANWKNPGPMVLKYTRNRSSVPATMIKQLVRDLVQESHPAKEDEDTILIDAQDVDLSTHEFFMQQARNTKGYDYKWHLVSVDDPTTTACRRLELGECRSVGTILADDSILCKACVKSRPDFVQ